MSRAQALALLQKFLIILKCSQDWGNLSKQKTIPSSLWLRDSNSSSRWRAFLLRRIDQRWPRDANTVMDHPRLPGLRGLLTHRTFNTKNEKSPRQTRSSWFTPDRDLIGELYISERGFIPSQLLSTCFEGKHSVMDPSSRCPALSMAMRWWGCPCCSNLHPWEECPEDHKRHGPRAMPWLRSHQSQNSAYFQNFCHVRMLV